MLGLLGFKKFITPIVVHVFYWIGTVAIVFYAGLAILLAMQGQEVIPGLYDTSVVIAIIPFAAVLMFLVWRMLCEAWIVLYTINDRLDVLVERSTR